MILFRERPALLPTQARPPAQRIGDLEPPRLVATGPQQEEPGCMLSLHVRHMFLAQSRRAPAQRVSWGPSEARAQTPRYLLFVWLLGPQGGQVCSAGLDAEMAIRWLRTGCY